MNGRDPVDSALEMLRSDDWAAENALKPIQERIMQSMNTPPRASRTGLTRVAVFAAAFVVLGGVAFAATGGIEKVRNWFVKLEINGQVTEMPLDENGIGTTTIQTADGGQATIHVQKTTTDGEKTRVQVIKTDANTSAESVAEIVRKHGAPEECGPATLADIEGAEAVAQVTAADGAVRSIYILPVTDGEGARIYMRTDVAGQDPAVRLVARTPRNPFAGGVKPTATIDDDGTLTLTSDNGGEKRVIKVRSNHMHAADAPPTIKVDSPAGEIKVEVNTQDNPK